MQQKSNVPTILSLEPISVRIEARVPSRMSGKAHPSDEDGTVAKESISYNLDLITVPHQPLLTLGNKEFVAGLNQRPNQSRRGRDFPVQIEFFEPQLEGVHLSDSQIREIADSKEKSRQQFFFELGANQKQAEIFTPKLENADFEEESQQLDIRQSQKHLFKNREKCLQEQESSDREKRLILTRRDFLMGSRLANLRLQLYRSIPAKERLVMSLAKSSHILSLFWPQFQLRFNNDQKPLLAGKRTSIKPYSTYIISTNPNDFDQRSSSFIGKVKTSLSGKVVNIFGPGLSPSAAERQHEIPRELLATIIYLRSQVQAPRQFTLFVKKEQFHYYLAFPQVKLYGPEITLNQLYKDTASRSKIQVYTNRIPVFDPRTQSYILNFRGKVQYPSVRNFILQDQMGQQVMLLGKSRDNHFNLQISHPLSALVGFALAMSSFESLWL